MNERVEKDSIGSAEMVIKSLSAAINSRMARPIYLKIEHLDGNLSIEQVEYITAEELAALVKTDVRTVYSWFERGVLGFCKPQGTGQNLIPLRAALNWIDSSATVRERKRKKEEG